MPRPYGGWAVQFRPGAQSKIFETGGDIMAKQYTHAQKIAYFSGRAQTGLNAKTGKPLSVEQVQEATKRLGELTSQPAPAAAAPVPKPGGGQSNSLQVNVVLTKTKNGKPFAQAYIDNKPK
jgi:hypothetical protein